MLHFSFDDEDKTQFVVLDANGNVTGNTAIDSKLSGGDGGLTATRRSGTNIAFIRADMTGGQETLARLDLTNGDIELRRLPSAFPGNPVYEAIGTSGSYPVAPFNTPGGLSSVSRVLGAEILNSLSSDFQMELIELPVDGSYPTCITYTASSIPLITPLPTSFGSAEIINLDDGWSTSGYSGPNGLKTSDISPELVTMNVAVEVICEDDGGGIVAPAVSFVKTSPTKGELRFDTTAETIYKIQRVGVLNRVDAFEDLQTVPGDGQMFSLEITLDGGQEYFRVVTQ